MAAAACIRVLVVDDSPTFRQTMRTLLATYPDIEQVGEASNGKEALECVQRLHPNVVLMDIHLHRVMDGIGATRLILAAYPNVAIIGMSLDKRQYVISGMEQAGAFEVLTKDEVTASDVHSAIQRAFASMRDSD